jgi:hypothetical protein
MDVLARILVGNPWAILAISALFLGAHLALRLRAPGRHLLVAGVAWALYAGWEWMVQARTPGANIRVDLLVIWPVVFLISAWAIYRCLR